MPVFFGGYCVMSKPDKKNGARFEDIPDEPCKIFFLRIIYHYFHFRLRSAENTDCTGFQDRPYSMRLPGAFSEASDTIGPFHDIDSAERGHPCRNRRDNNIARDRNHSLRHHDY